MKKSLFCIAALLLLLTFILPGCSRTIPAVASTHWLDLLKTMPANQDTMRDVYLNDFTKLNEKFAQNPQLQPAYTSYYHPLIGGLIGGGGYDEKEWQQTLTFTWKDMQQSIYAGDISVAGLPDFHVYQAVRCQFDKTKLDNAVKTGPLNDILQIVSYQGQQYYSWGGDNEINLSRRSTLRPLGLGYRLALLNNYLFWIQTTDGMKEIIDTYNKDVASLADKPDYQLLAAAMDDLDTTNTFFSSESQSLSSIRTWRTQTPDQFVNGQDQRFFTATDGSTLLKPFPAYAVGAGIDEKGSYMAIVLLNADNNTASKNAQLLATRISKYQSVWQGLKWADLIENTKIESQGKLTVAKLYGPIAANWTSFDKWNGEYEPLLVTE
jgi:hypothetical protein